MVRAWIISKSVNGPLTSKSLPGSPISQPGDGHHKRKLGQDPGEASDGKRGNYFWATLYVAEIVLDAFQRDLGEYEQKEEECWPTSGVMPARPIRIPGWYPQWPAVCRCPPHCQVSALRALFATLAQSPGESPGTKQCLVNTFWINDSHVLSHRLIALKTASTVQVNQEGRGPSWGYQRTVDSLL